jgi:hypothetical protein
MDTRFWGPSGWRLLHLVAASRNKDAKDFFELLPFVLPCKFCRASLTDYIQNDPIPSDSNDYPHWIYRIHNRVNSKLKEQGLPTAKAPSFTQIKKKYDSLLKQPCTINNMVGWDFLFSIAYTHPCDSVKSSPLANSPNESTLTDPILRNRWNVMTKQERLPYLEKFWIKALPNALPFKEWKDAWHSCSSSSKPPLNKDRKDMTDWLFDIEKCICKILSQPSPIHSFISLCKELSAFESKCSNTKKKTVRTCRSVQKKKRETIKNRHKNIYKATGGFR